VTVTVAIGLPLWESVEHLPEALESLLAQTRRDFVLVVVDDSRSDGPAGIVRRYDDPRIAYSRNPRRLGLAANWRHAFALARTLAPELRYFAWAGDHDSWDPGWLATLAAELDAHPEAVLAYGSSGGRTWRFETRGERSAARRYASTLRRMVAGEMVYGLYRAEALERAGVFRRVLQPDRLLLAELALAGEFLQVPEVLWRRRPLARYSRARQLAATFPEGVPAWARLPWWLPHAAHVARAHGAAAGAAYAVLAPAFGLGHRLSAVSKSSTVGV
jgi:glycosyltransferase involved in cell wall biosynthesis